MLGVKREATDVQDKVKLCEAYARTDGWKDDVLNGKNTEAWIRETETGLSAWMAKLG